MGTGKVCAQHPQQKGISVKGILTLLHPLSVHFVQKDLSGEAHRPEQHRQAPVLQDDPTRLKARATYFGPTAAARPNPRRTQQ